MWWIGDWACYGERQYGDIRQAADALGYERGSFWDAKWVAGAIKTSDRSEVLSWTHHRQVASLPSKEQHDLLKEAVAHDWSVKELQQVVRSHRQLKESTPLPPGTFDIIYADPPRQTDALLWLRVS